MKILEYIVYALLGALSWYIFVWLPTSHDDSTWDSDEHHERR